MRKLLDAMLLIFCIGTLVNGSSLVIENLELLIFFIGWFILLAITLFLIATTTIFPIKFKKEKDKEIEENRKDPKN